MKNHNDDIILVGSKNGYYIYYDHRNKQQFMITPNHRAIRYFKHCNNEEITKWAENMIDKYLEKCKYDQNKNDNEINEFVKTLKIKTTEYLKNRKYPLINYDRNDIENINMN